MSLQFFECGCCDHFHLVNWYGDCREDKSRFTYEEMDKKAFNETGQPPDYTTIEEQMDNET